VFLVDLDILGSSTSGIGALGFSASSFVIQLITFILAFLVLKKWAFQPITKVLRERRETIDRGVTLGQQMQKDKLELEERIAKEIAAARAKADAIIGDANTAGKELIHKAEADAEAKAQAIINEAREQTKQDITRARRKLEAEIIDLIAEATEVITGEKVDPKKDAELIDRALAQEVQR
jgi:F-type H+-transporting ATPase subunit b